MGSKNKIQEKINRAMRLVDISYRVPKNTVRVSKANDIYHELAKFLKCMELLYENREFYTEVTFKSGGRADIFVPEDMRVFEILYSETEEEFLSKEEYYPEGLDLVSIDSVKFVCERLPGMSGWEEWIKDDVWDDIL